MPTVEAALEGALHIVAERIAENSGIPEAASRSHAQPRVSVRAKVVTGKESEKTKYEMYYNFEETVPKIPSHRMLAIRRGTREGILTFTIDMENDKFIAGLISAGGPRPHSRSLRRFLNARSAMLTSGCFCRQFRMKCGRFCANAPSRKPSRFLKRILRTLLLAPPAGPIGGHGRRSGQRTGCKIAVVDETGKFLENQTIHPTEPKQDLEGAEKIFSIWSRNTTSVVLRSAMARVREKPILLSARSSRNTSWMSSSSS